MLKLLLLLCAKMLVREEFLLTLSVIKKKKGYFISSWSRSEVWKVPAEPLCHLSSYQGALAAGVGINPEKASTSPGKNLTGKGSLQHQIRGSQSTKF